MLAQNALLLLLVYRHAPPAAFRAAALWGAYAAALGAYLSGAVPPAAVERAYGASHAVFWFARATQIAANARARSTGALSPTSTLLQCAGGAGAPARPARSAPTAAAIDQRARSRARIRSRPRGAVRILTTLQEGGGRAMLAGYAVGLALNLVLLAQCALLGDAAGGAAGGARRGRAPTGPRRRAKQA
jgi:hypothetical protein